MNNVFVLGSINVDLVFEVDKIPVKGETLPGRNFFTAAGGKGANQAVACAKQGIPTWMIGSIGSDSLAATSLSSLEEAGVHTEYIQTVENHHTGVAGIFIEQGDNRIVLGPGANQIHDVQNIQSILQNNVKQGDILLCQLEIPIEVLQEVLPYASKLGMTILLNAAPATTLPNNMKEVIDVLIVNETELMTLVNGKGHTKEDFESLAATLVKEVPAVLVTLGDQGSFYISEEDTVWSDAKTVPIVDTTGAGDTFIGGFIAAILENKPIQECLYYASSSAELAIQIHGAQPSIPTKQEVLDYIKKVGQ